MTEQRLIKLLDEITACQLCSDLPLGPRPVLSASSTARILVIGQAPGTRVHATGIPWNDPSGDRLRNWMGLDCEAFYDSRHIAIMPMGFCYPGKGKSGDLPPRSECAPQWHQAVTELLPNIQLTLLIGQYAQNYYFQKGGLGKSGETLTQRVANWHNYLPEYFPLVHPSPRNQLWLKRNPWFEQEVVPELMDRVGEVLGGRVV